MPFSKFYGTTKLVGEAILSACHLKNRIPYKKTRVTPYELLKGYAPSLKYLKVWGCLANVLLPEPRKRKLGPKSFDAMFIRYAQNSAAYRFLVINGDQNLLEVNTIVETKNATFFENIFPMKFDGDKPTNVSHSLPEPSENLEIEPRKSKRVRKETSFGDDFYTFL